MTALRSFSNAFISHSPLRISFTSKHAICSLRYRRISNPFCPSTIFCTSTPPSSPSTQTPKTSSESTSPSPSPNPLPSSSQSALNSCFLTAISAISIPLVLSLHDSISSHTPLFTALSHYDSHFRIALFCFLFGILHSGLASLRPVLIPPLSERIYRILFALLSLPSATGLITYFISHRYDGLQLWTLQGLPFTRPIVYSLTFISFLLLYPATFNLLEVAAVQKPSFRIYETGITRITRHPQLWGQALWCVAHSMWIGSTFCITASLALVAHHFFGAWNGDRRLRDKYGEEWNNYEQRTSLVPFVAVAQGKQTLKPQEFFRWAYVGVVAFVLGGYAAHPYVLRLIGELNW